MPGCPKLFLAVLFSHQTKRNRKAPDFTQGPSARQSNSQHPGPSCPPVSMLAVQRNAVARGPPSCICQTYSKLNVQSCIYFGLAATMITHIHQACIYLSVAYAQQCHTDEEPCSRPMEAKLMIAWGGVGWPRGRQCNSTAPAEVALLKLRALADISLYCVPLQVEHSEGCQCYDMNLTTCLQHRTASKRPHTPPEAPDPQLYYTHLLHCPS